MYIGCQFRLQSTPARRTNVKQGHPTRLLGRMGHPPIRFSGARDPEQLDQQLQRICSIAAPVEGLGLTDSDDTRPLTYSDTLPAPSQVSQDWSWTKQWYPVAVVNDLSPAVPWGTKLLGKELVIWKDKDGCWRAFEDRCPHRLAPLSQGRIETSDGSLQCSYHGWRFNGQGKAAAIPQAAHDGPKVEAMATSSKRSCVASYPTQVANGYLWVWPEAGPEALQQSSGREPAINSQVRELKPGEVQLTTNLNFVRDFPVAYDIMMENISDQSHVPFAHHGVGGSRTSPWAAHFEVTNVNKDVKGPDGYTYDLEWSPDGINPPIKQNVTMVPPSYIEYYTKKEKGFTAHWFYVVPIDEHRSRVFNHAVHTAPLPPLLGWLAGKRPRWIDHLLLNEIFDGDLAYLCKASQNAKQHEATGRTWAKEYFLPANADGSVPAWRKWFHGRGKSGWLAASGQAVHLPPDVPTSEVFDRYNQHTKHCPDCSKALQQLKVAQVLLKAAGIAILLLLASKAGQGEPLASFKGLTLVIGAVMAFWLSSWLHGAESKFTYAEYEHGKR